MDMDTIRFLYSYDSRVNQRLLADAERLPSERTRESFGASFDTIHGTLAHILGSQINWLSRWRGVSPTRQVTGAAFASLSAIRQRWEEHRQELEAFIAGLTDADLHAPLDYRNIEGKSYALPLWEQMVHVVNHGTHHRSELADMLTRCGHAPEPTDLIRYCLTRTGQE
ncbi:MAG TPA: DinB family protein [Chloroflexota bacterium]|nr:DinB family protein [Chloroflexota bacterium]